MALTKVFTQHSGAPVRYKRDRTYHVVGLLAADEQLHILHTCKTKRTAVKYARQALDTLLYLRVTISCMVMHKPVYSK